MSDIPLLTQLQSKFADGIVSVELDSIDEWIEVTPGVLVVVCEFLRDAPDYHFDMCNCITAVDYLHTDPKLAAKVEWAPHLELVYHLSSIATKMTLVIKLFNKCRKVRIRNGIDIHCSRQMSPHSF